MGAPAIVIRALLLDELDVIHDLNQAEVPHVGDATRDRLRDILGYADVAHGAEVDGELVGFVIGMGAETGYDSANYRWFRDRHPDFLYIDRIVVRADARGRGIGRALYDAALDIEPAPLLTAEVNVEPPNPDSMAFHERYGFTEVARVEHRTGYTVAMLAKGTGLTRDED